MGNHTVNTKKTGRPAGEDVKVIINCMEIRPLEKSLERENSSRKKVADFINPDDIVYETEKYVAIKAITTVQEKDRD